MSSVRNDLSETNQESPENPIDASSSNMEIDQPVLLKEAENKESPENEEQKLSIKSPENSSEKPIESAENKEPESKEHESTSPIEPKPESNLMDLDKQGKEGQVIDSLVSPNTSLIHSIIGDFSSGSTLFLNSNPVEKTEINWNFRSLQITENKLLLTGAGQAYYLDINDQILTPTAAPLKNRSLHAMSFVKNLPAVIAGKSEDPESPLLSSVEVFENNEWREASPLNTARYGHSACVCENVTWVVGGARSKNEGILSIERFEKDSWSDCQVKLYTELVGPGLVAIGKRIVVIGGFSVSKEVLKDVKVIDTESNEVFEDGFLDIGSCFSQNHWVFNGLVLEGWAFNGQRVSYELKNRL